MTVCRLLLLSVSTALLSGCCSMSRFFCGPDESPWVSESYDTPENAVHTLLEAIRRDQPGVVYRTFSLAFKSRHHLDGVVAQLTWQRLREEVPGLHMIGYAEVPPRQQLADNGATFELNASGQRIRVDVVQEAYLEITYRRADGTLGEIRNPLLSFNKLARIAKVDDPDFDRSELLFEPIPFDHEGQGAVPLETIERAGLVRLWRVEDLRILDP